jgi:hypothetical protein
LTLPPYRALLAASLTASLLVVACGGRERAAKAEAAGVVRAVAALRDAPNEAKSVLLPELERLRCTDAEVCELQRVCASAYQRHLGALAKTESVKRQLDAGSGAAQAGALAGILLEAERELERGRALGERCTELEGALRRRFQL